MPAVDGVGASRDRHEHGGEQRDADRVEPSSNSERYDEDDASREGGDGRELGTQTAVVRAPICSPQNGTLSMVHCRSVALDVRTRHSETIFDGAGCRPRQ
jgi:hypothetical protein